MSMIQPGVGYGFITSGGSTTLNVDNQWYDLSPTPITPFRIYLAGKDGSDFLFSCVPGTVNSLIPVLGSTSVTMSKRLDQTPVPTTKFFFDDDGYSYIHLKVSSYYDSGIVTFPVNTITDILYPRVISNSEQQFSTVDSVFYLIATAYKDPATDNITINQFATASLWCDRIQVGSLEAIPNYFFARS